MSNKYVDILGLELDANGRVVLNNDHLRALEAAAQVPTAGGVTNSADCRNTSNSDCRNTSACGGSSNEACVNGSYYYNCKDVRETGEGPIGP